MENEQFNPNNLNDPVPEVDELQFDLSGVESYYERRVLKVGQGVLDLVNNTSEE